MTTPLAQHIYGDGTPYPDGSITDLSGRTWGCCADGLSIDSESAGFAMRLPAMTGDSFVAVSDARQYGGVTVDDWITRYTSDGVVYDYSYEASAFIPNPTERDMHIDHVTITGPEGYSAEVDISMRFLRDTPVITSVTNALDQVTSYSYDQSHHRLTGIGYPEGNSLSVEYDGAGNITRRSAHPDGGGTALTEEAGYDNANPAFHCNADGAPDVRCWRPLWTEDEASNQTDYTWDAQGNLLTMTEPVDANGRRRQTINTWTAHTFGNNTIYRLTRQRICSIGPDSDCGTVAEQRTNYTYWEDTFLPLTVSRTNGGTNPAPPVATTTYSYDDAGRVLIEDGPLSGTSDAAYFRYDLSGRRTWEIGRVGAVSPYRATTRTTWREEDDQPELVEAGRINSPTATTLTVAHQSDYLYNTRRLATRERAIGDDSVIYAVSQHQYDDRNRRTCTAARMNPAEFNTLPGNACNLDTTGSMGPDRIQRTTWDALSRPTQIVGGYRVLGTAGAGNVEIELGYTANGQVAWRKDGRGNETSYTYDDYDRLERATFPDASYERVMSYDPRGLILQRRNRAGRLIDHSYDGAGRLTLTSYSGAAAEEPPIAYEYDGQGREIEIERDSAIANNDSRLTIAYDALGRRASETQRIGSGPNRTVAWQYDIAGRPTRLTWPDAFYVTYEHSPAAQLTAIEEAGGAALVSFEYNINGWLNRIVRANGLETALAFDPVGRVSRINHIGLVYTDFTYNPASQIATRALSGNNWAWDEGLNVDLDYDVNNLNQYTEVGTTGFAYDLNGNLTDDGPNTYGYDPENRMLRSTRGGGGGTIQLRYDGRGRLMRRWGAGDTGYIYDGDAMIAEYDENDGDVLRRYIHGAGVDDPLIWYEGSGTGASARRYLHADERGSITTTTNNTGGIIQRNRYDEWGVPASTNIGRFQYTGQQWLPEIGLYYYKARFYAPALGRFMQTDPIGYEDGMNLYAYVGNDPLNGSDPTGREERQDPDFLCTRVPNSNQCSGESALGGAVQAGTPRRRQPEQNSSNSSGSWLSDYASSGLSNIAGIPSDLADLFGLIAEGDLGNAFGGLPPTLGGGVVSAGVGNLLRGFSTAGRAAPSAAPAMSATSDVFSLNTATAQRASTSLRAPIVPQPLRNVRGATLDRSPIDHARYWASQRSSGTLDRARGSAGRILNNIGDWLRGLDDLGGN